MAEAEYIELRKRALELAVQISFEGEPAGNVIERANEYLVFMTGSDIKPHIEKQA